MHWSNQCFSHELLLCMCEVFQSDLDISVGCSTETLLQEIKSVVAETNQFERRDVSINFEVSENFRVSAFQR